MPLTTETVELRVITPENPENWLTNGETYSQKVYLGCEDEPENWSEVPVEEYENHIAETSI